MNTLGRALRFTSFGESHGPAIGGVIDGCPPGIALCEDDFANDLQRRATGRTRHTSQRHETDQVEILSGVFEGKTTGTPIALLIRNTDAKSKDYGDIKDRFRPGHADFTYQQKYAHRDYRGGGRSSARETASRVAAAVVAKKILFAESNTRVQAFLSQCGAIQAQLGPLQSSADIDWQCVESTPLFWPVTAQIAELEAYLDGVRKSGDSVGGKVVVMADPMPVGLGEPIFGKLDGDLAAALMGINAVKAVEIGDGVLVAGQRGSEHRDELRSRGFLSNHAGGILGGISTGQSLIATVSIKPTSSILVPGQTIDVSGTERDLITKGRHDPCVAIRAPAIVEAMTAWVLADHLMRDRAQNAHVTRQSFR